MENYFGLSRVYGYGDNDYAQKIFFENGYGVSIIRGRSSYGYEEGLYELAILKGTASSHCICYDTPITDDVIGFLTMPEAMEIASQVAAL